ncbi:MAG TPA: hypothetical protein VGN34_02435 [Ktedonobacteraceae bacterium]|jgi:hypothetical protein
MAEHKIQVATTLFQNASSGATDERATKLPAINRQMRKQKYIVIWTPGFMVLFGIVCTLGLSLASVLTQGWLNGYYPGDAVLLGYALIVLGLLLTLLRRTKNLWLRFAALFGCGWIVLTSCSFLVNIFQLTNEPIVAPHINAAATSALLGAFVCLSLDSAYFNRWDRWFFRLAPVILVVSLLAAYVFGSFQLIILENTFAGVALCLAIATWWLRLSCWRSQPLPAFLFGLVPLIQLLFILPHSSEANFFYTQVLFLAMILGLLRVLQKERRWEALKNNHSSSR